MARQDGRGNIEIPSERPPPLVGGHTIGIRRTGAAVEITLTSADDYAAMELYDNLVQSVERGYLRLELKLPRS